MSGPWWRVDAQTRPANLLGRLFSAEEPPDPSATLRRIPRLLPLTAARVERERPDSAATASADCRSAGFTIDSARHQYGFVKIWRAKSVDLRPLLFASAREPSTALRQSQPTEPQPAASAPASSLPRQTNRTRLDDLARRLLRVLQPPPEMLLHLQGPLAWPHDFFPYQREGIRALLYSTRLLLGDDMGLGKTIQAIAALRILLFRREITRALVVAPASLLEQWRRELSRWSPELKVMVVQGTSDNRLWQWQTPVHITLTSYETLRSDFTGTSAYGPCRETWGVVVLDEAQKIKNRGTDIARICKRLPRLRSWAMTGTPLENSPDDVASILEFVTGPAPEGKRVAIPPSGFALRATLGEYQLRRRKADVLQDLPPKIVTELALPLTAEQRRAYDRAEQEGIVALRNQGEVRIEHILALITRLKQICNFTSSGKASAKLEDLASRLAELAAAQHQALIFTQYTDDESGARRIAEGLKAFAPLVFTGDMDTLARDQVVERFQRETQHKALILSLKAGGQGLNLQNASYVFHFDRWWNPAVERQAEDRAHRLGQQRPVHVYKYVMTDTIEQRIDTILKSKRALFEEIVEDVSLDITQFKGKRLLDERELFGLFDLEPPSASHPSQPGVELERRVAALLTQQGYLVKQTPRSRDGGVDVIAEKTDAVGTRVQLLIQCKDYRHPVGVEVIRSLNGVLSPENRGVIGVVVCPAGFTQEARNFATERHIQLWDESKLDSLEKQG